LSVNKTNCDDFTPVIFVRNIELALLVSIFNIRLWRNFARSQIFAGFGINAGFWPEPDSGATLKKCRQKQIVQEKVSN